MNWHRVANWVFPYIEPLTATQKTAQAWRLQQDRVAIQAANWARNEERALDEVQKVAAAEMERVRTAEGKATTYLAVLAALVPVIITLQAANWEKKAGPAPDAARLFVLTLATVYVAAAGYHAFMTLQVRGFQKVGESEIVAAWRTPNPLSKLIRGTLLATRNSRDVVNEKVTRILVTHEHLLRAFGLFILLLLLDPLFYAMGFRNAAQAPSAAKVAIVRRTVAETPSEPKCTPSRTTTSSCGGCTPAAESSMTVRQPNGQRENHRSSSAPSVPAGHSIRASEAAPTDPVASTRRNAAETP